MKKRAEAATFLGISTRTLDRYTKAGRIPCRVQKGRTRPNVVYDEEDLAALKAELDEQRTPQAEATPSSTAMQRIGFRLEPFYIKKLEEDGARQGMTAEAYARHLVIRSLESESHEPVLAAIAGLQEEIEGLKRALVLPTVLAADGKAELPGALEKMQALREELIDYRKEFAMVVFLLLQNTARFSPDEISRWIRKNLSYTENVTLLR